MFKNTQVLSQYNLVQMSHQFILAYIQCLYLLALESSCLFNRCKLHWMGKPHRLHDDCLILFECYITE